MVKLWMNKHKIMLDIEKDQIIFISDFCDHDGASLATTSSKSQMSNSQHDNKPHAAESSAFPIKQIEVAVLAAATTLPTLARVVPPTFKVKKKKKPKSHTGAAKLTLFPENKEPEVLNITKISAFAFHL